MNTTLPDTDKYPGLIVRFSVPLLVAAIISILSPAAFSQQVAGEASENEEAGDDVVELSPFVIDAKSETGWVATETLAGSRLKSSFKDIAAPIEVLTMDFMDDYAINNIEEGAKYTVNVESGDDITLGNGLPNSNGTGIIRIRGLAGPTNSREFFSSLAPSDNYNIDRLTIASGPNSILFGTGSPAGAIDSSVRRPAWGESGGNVALQVDSYGGYRGSIDYNQVIKEDMLAIRGQVLYNERKWDYQDASQTDERFNVGLTFKPFKDTLLWVNYEGIEIDSNRASQLYPTDGITPWYESATYGYGGGYPSRYIFPNDVAWIEGGDGVGERFLPPNPPAGAYPIPGEQQQLFTTAGNFPVVVSGPNAISQVWGWRNTVEINEPQNWNNVSTINQEADGWTLLNDKYYPTDVNTLTDLQGGTTKWEIFNANFSQKIIENLYFDAAYAYQQEDLFSWEKVNYIGGVAPQIDANMYLPDGVTPNPNAGKTYFQGYPAYSKGDHTQQDWRLAVSYELDFAQKTEKWGWLGRHRLAGLISNFQSEQRQQAYRYHIQPKEENGVWRDPVFPGLEYAVDTLTEGINASPLISSPYQTTTVDGVSSIVFDNNGNPALQNNSSWRTSGDRRPQNRVYVDDANPIPYSSAMIPGQPWTITDATGEAWTMTPESWFVQDGVRWVSREGFSPQGKTNQDTAQFTYQGYFWNNRIIATYGYREDKIKAASLDYINDRQNGVQENFFDVEFGDYGDEDSGTTQTIGIVAYPFQGWLNLPYGFDLGGFYNESDTYQPATQNYDPYGTLYPGALGDGQDYGVIINMFEGKLNARFNVYTNTSGPQRAGNVPFNRFRFTLNGSFNRMLQLAPSIQGDANWPRNTEGGLERVYNELGAGDPYWVVSFREATGEEFSLNYNATRNLSVRFTWNHEDVVESDIGNDWWRLLDQVEPIWDSTTFPENGETNPQDRNGDGIISQGLTWADAPQNNNQWAQFVAGGPQTYYTVKQRYEDQVINGNTGKGIIQALDGKSNEYVRTHRWNLNANYRFTEGALNGWDVGGAIRWRAAPLIGYGDTTVAGTTIVNLDEPIYGDDQTFLDLRVGYRGVMPFFGDSNYRVNLVVNNVTDYTGPYPSMADVDGYPLRIQRLGGRQFILQFEFDI